MTSASSISSVSRQLFLKGEICSPPSRALPEEAADFAVVAPETVSDSAATPEPFATIRHWQLRIKLDKKVHPAIAQRAIGILRVLNPAWLASNPVQVFTAVAESPVLPTPLRRSLYDFDICFLQWANGKLRRTRIAAMYDTYMSLRGGWVWNLWGRNCVVLRLRKGILRVGTDDAVNLVEFLNARLVDAQRLDNGYD